MSETNNNFQDLKRLLKLKQHEIPPPGYFNQFSGDVMARIRTGESGGPQGVLEQIQAGSPFFGTLLRIFEAKPGVIGAFATSLCLLLLIGVVLADRPDAPADTAGSAIAANPMAAQSVSDANPVLASSAGLMPAVDSGITLSTNSVASLQPVAALFGSQQQNPLFQNAAFMPASQ